MTYIFLRFKSVIQKYTTSDFLEIIMALEVKIPQIVGSGARDGRMRSGEL